MERTDYFLDCPLVWFCFPGNSVGKESPCSAGDPGSIPGLGRFPWRGDRLLTPVFLGFPSGSAGKEVLYNVGDLGSIPDWEDPLEKGNGYPLQYSGLENSLGCVVHGVTKSWTQLSDFHVLRFLLCFHHWDETVHFWQE